MPSFWVAVEHQDRSLGTSEGLPIAQMGEQTAHRHPCPSVPDVSMRGHHSRGRRSTRLLALAGSAFLALSSAAPALAAPPAGVAAGGADSSWIVTLVPGHAAPRLAGVLARDVGGRIGQTYTHAINGFQFTGSAAAAQALRRNPNVVSVAPDRPITLTGETLPTG